MATVVAPPDALETALAQDDADAARVPDEAPDETTKKRRGRPPGSRTKNRAPKADTPPSAPRGRPPSHRALANKLEAQLVSLSLVVSAVNPADGAVILANASPVADAYAKLAQENAMVKKILEGSMTGSAWLGALFATTGMLVPIAMNHGLITMRNPFAPAEDADNAGG